MGKKKRQKEKRHEDVSSQFACIQAILAINDETWMVACHLQDFHAIFLNTTTFHTRQVTGM